MRFFVFGPRVGPVRTGVSLSAKDLKGSPRTAQRKKTLRALGMMLLIVYALSALVVLSWFPADLQGVSLVSFAVACLIFWGLASALG